MPSFGTLRSAGASTAAKRNHQTITRTIGIVARQGGRQGMGTRTCSSSKAEPGGGVHGRGKAQRASPAKHVASCEAVQHRGEVTRTYESHNRHTHYASRPSPSPAATRWAAHTPDPPTPLGLANLLTTTGTAGGRRGHNQLSNHNTNQHNLRSTLSLTQPKPYSTQLTHGAAATAHPRPGNSPLSLGSGCPKVHPSRPQVDGHQGSQAAAPAPSANN